MGRSNKSPFDKLFYKFNYKLEGWNKIQLKLINNTDIAEANANP
jgi:hypothetical protein